MKIYTRQVFRIVFLPVFTLALGAVLHSPAGAQNPELQQRLAEVKDASARNKMELGQYTWVEQVTISLKGEQKKQEHFQVRLGPDGKPQKTSIDPAPADEGESGGRLKRHIVEKKKEEYKDYAEQMKALAQQYIPPDKEMLQQAYQQGNVTLGSVAGSATEVQLVIHNYVKQGDSMTIVFDKAQKEILRLQIASWMDDPKDAMNLTVQFSKLPGGPNHVSSVMMDGVSKQLQIATQNMNYQHL
jgi:hypothetical protein